MIALEFKEMIEVSTSKGDGYMVYDRLRTKYGYALHHRNKESGECRQMTHKDLKVKSNITMGIRGSYSKPPLNGNYNSVKQMDE